MSTSRRFGEINDKSLVDDSPTFWEQFREHSVLSVGTHIFTTSSSAVENAIFTSADQQSFEKSSPGRRIISVYLKKYHHGRGTKVRSTSLNRNAIRSWCFQGCACDLKYTFLRFLFADTSILPCHPHLSYHTVLSPSLYHLPSSAPLLHLCS